MLLSFEFQDETIKFKTFCLEPLKVVNSIDGVEVEHEYNPIIHQHLAAKVFKGILRKETYIPVVMGRFNDIEGDLRQMLVKLDDIADLVRKGITLCEQLKNEKEKSLLTTEK